MERVNVAFSGGQRQRARIAMRLVRDTNILLLDAITTSLDLAHRLEELDLLDNLNQAWVSTIKISLVPIYLLKTSKIIPKSDKKHQKIYLV